MTFIDFEGKKKPKLDWEIEYVWLKVIKKKKQPTRIVPNEQSYERASFVCTHE